ncbi:class I SAM-dependent methyltransferase [Bradyrhizobium sp. LHD-71]|uniref:class I SAM-dependent methyltransferase n=1 Tax=Bradyrhizobium sp. LHD-71 TaxID=3072141 RepID=UPI00280D3EF0|nr:class I SAM-dependent methyltransferase [Bradyrhizobium sp. LHD-71]MDQ8728352.1 class I SAM-dependent methyltransferase [Bradyrhizobium sp. LHD-71]
MSERILPPNQEPRDWRAFYEASDRSAKTADRRLSRVFVNDYAMHWSDSPHATEMGELKSFSMLHQETLSLLGYFARRSQGAVLELGAYLGGATISIAKALQQSGGGPQITVEVGGAHPTHPDYPTDDILRDLKRNIKKFNVEPIVNLVEGWSDAPEVVAQVERLLNGRKIDLLFIDSDGRTRRDMDIYGKFLSQDCIIVLDDFLVAVADAADKEVGVRNWVAWATETGLVTDLGVHQWATWVGQYNGRGDR